MTTPAVVCSRCGAENDAVRMERSDPANENLVYRCRKCHHIWSPRTGGPELLTGGAHRGGKTTALGAAFDEAMAALRPPPPPPVPPQWLDPSVEVERP